MGKALRSNAHDDTLLLDPASLSASRSSRAAALAVEQTLGRWSSYAPASVRGTRLVLGLVIRALAPTIGIPASRESTRFTGGRVIGEWVGRRKPVAGERIVYYLHGSAFLALTAASYRGYVAQLCRATGRPAFTLDYRLAPEHPFPAAHDDALRGYRWLLAIGFRAEDIIVAGDSAGGQLALSLIATLRATGERQPSGVVVVSPAVDLTGAVIHPPVRDPLASVDLLRAAFARYTDGADLGDPRLDARRGVGPELPPVLIQVGSEEILAAHAVAYADALQAVGGRCRLQVWPGQFHGFHLAYHLLPEARASLTHIRAFTRQLDTMPDTAVEDTPQH